MKKLLLIIGIVFTFNVAQASLPNIVASVNDKPITLNEFHARKKMIMALNNVESLTPAQNKQLSDLAIKSLIDESLLFQYAGDREILQEEIDNAIKSIEDRNKMPHGSLLQYLKSRSVNPDSFISQIKSELIKMNILSSLSRSVQVSNKEIDVAILSSDQKDLEISMQVFTSKDRGNKAFMQMNNLKNRLKKCTDVKKSLYDNFATMQIITDKLSKIEDVKQTIVKDLTPDKASNVFEVNNKFEIILVCSKKILNVNEDENNYVVNFLTNKKISQKAQKMFENMRKKASIKIMLPS
ncbi:MAG: SurA N-terminal domain-containing protein [Rickettsia endosymbiont of Ixodes persulcatus]|nr:SurA N-terminal domain-containing protein [Rickettsia endosymbiont of Ixodes persulcatus]MCZ6903554.1 SurA N-terminal domain-containing protein [Rickettsia endosymbiont of Ixodes persulcatus]MCZ6908450.1 SurA N-terminal domain-containing protein [Rickettsia endosymbiont of Ixodes persulcatus]MCZ6909973.1 SurA N-terminal domain-containing protein [Rickettsia endosymbiont of Ixodes persulcatus]MCZ6914735.1 SurA N-terminal domain-containing protein [Rickettsia endosymbiont of Ixodes persulcatus